MRLKCLNPDDYDSYQTLTVLDVSDVWGMGKDGKQYWPVYRHDGDHKVMMK